MTDFWVVLSIASVECDSLEIETAIKVDRCDDVPLTDVLTSAANEGDRGRYSLQCWKKTTVAHTSTRRRSRSVGCHTVTSLLGSVLLTIHLPIALVVSIFLRGRRRQVSSSTWEGQ